VGLVTLDVDVDSQRLEIVYEAIATDGHGPLLTEHLQRPVVESRDMNLRRDGNPLGVDGEDVPLPGAVNTREDLDGPVVCTRQDRSHLLLVPPTPVSE
jgi:hypothetical protein